MEGVDVNWIEPSRPLYHNSEKYAKVTPKLHQAEEFGARAWPLQVKDRRRARLVPEQLKYAYNRVCQG